MYEEAFDTMPNTWLKDDANCFEIVPNDMKTIKIYHDGKIDKVDLKGTKKVKYVYVDSENKEHQLKGEFNLIEVDELKNGKSISSIPIDFTSEETISNNRKKYTYSDYIVIKGTTGSEDGKIRKYKLTGKRVQLIKFKDFKYKKNNLLIKFKILSTGTRPFINANSYASMIGAIAEVQYKDITVVGFTSEDNHGFPSKTHVNGRNGDFRYLRTDESGNSLHIDTNPTNLDKVRQEKFIDALKKFGWPKFYSYNYTINNIQTILKDSDHLSHHNHHLHSRLYSEKFKN